MYLSDNVIANFKRYVPGWYERNWHVITSNLEHLNQRQLKEIHKRIVFLQTTENIEMEASVMYFIEAKIALL